MFLFSVHSLPWSSLVTLLRGTQDEQKELAMHSMSSHGGGPYPVLAFVLEVTGFFVLFCFLVWSDKKNDKRDKQTDIPYSVLSPSIYNSQSWTCSSQELRLHSRSRNRVARTQLLASSSVAFESGKKLELTVEAKV